MYMAFINWFLSSTLNKVFGYSSSDDAIGQACKIPVVPSTKYDEICKKMGKTTEFEMPLNYPRYTKSDYEKMEEWHVDILLHQYGLQCQGNLKEKREFAMGAFLWPDAN